MATQFAKGLNRLTWHRSSSELDRLMRRRYWMQVFWMVISAGELIYCLVSATIVTPGLLSTWRGAALLVVATLYIGWLAWGVWQSPHLRACLTDSPDLARGIRVWLVTLLLTLGLFALHPMMGWMAYPVFGMAFTVFELPWALIPGVLGFLLIPITVVRNGYATISDVTQPGALVAWALSFCLFPIVIYWPTKLMRDRIRREVGVAELERVHGELQEAHRQLESSAEREREVAVLRERGRLARDMHDTLGHALVLIAVKVEAARRLRGVDATRADHELEATQQIVRDAMAELRASLAALRSPVLGRESPGHMLATFAHDAAQRADWHVIYDITHDLGEVGTAEREALLRVGAEALTNVERHAHARTVTVTLKRDADGGIELRVADDGVGLGETAQAHDRPHYGITGMRERVAALGGHFAIEPGVAGGTVVAMRLPALNGVRDATTPSCGPSAVPSAPAVAEASDSPSPSLALPQATVA